MPDDKYYINYAPAATTSVSDPRIPMWYGKSPSPGVPFQFPKPPDLNRVILGQRYDEMLRNAEIQKMYNLVPETIKKMSAQESGDNQFSYYDNYATNVLQCVGKRGNSKYCGYTLMGVFDDMIKKYPQYADYIKKYQAFLSPSVATSKRYVESHKNDYIISRKPIPHSVMLWVGKDGAHTEWTNAVERNKRGDITRIINYGGNTSIPAFGGKEGIGEKPRITTREGVPIAYAGKGDIIWVRPKDLPDLSNFNAPFFMGKK